MGDSVHFEVLVAGFAVKRRECVSRLDIPRYEESDDDDHQRVVTLTKVIVCVFDCVSDPTCDTCSDHGVDSKSQLTVKKKETVSPQKWNNNKRMVLVSVRDQ